MVVNLYIDSTQCNIILKYAFNENRGFFVLFIIFLMHVAVDVYDYYVIELILSNYRYLNWECNKYFIHSIIYFFFL